MRISKQSTPNQATLLLGIMIFATPLVGRIGSFEGKLFIVLMSIITIFLIGFFIFMLAKQKINTYDKLFQKYIEIFIFYSLAYAFAVVVAPSGHFISGLHQICDCENYSEINLFYTFGEIGRLLIDSMYFSIVTMTSLGDGSIQVKGIFRIFVASQTAFTFFITVYGLAKILQTESSKEIKEMIKFENTKNIQNATKTNVSHLNLLSRMKLAVTIIFNK